MEEENNSPRRDKMRVCAYAVTLSKRVFHHCTTKRKACVSSVECVLLPTRSVILRVKMGDSFVITAHVESARAYCNNRSSFVCRVQNCCVVACLYIVQNTKNNGVPMYICIHGSAVQSTLRNDFDVVLKKVRTYLCCASSLVCESVLRRPAPVHTARVLLYDHFCHRSLKCVRSSMYTFPQMLVTNFITPCSHTVLSDNFFCRL